MNIKFGMDNFYTRYLKRFLANEMNRSTTVLGEFDKNDLDLLVKYLNLPNVKDMFSVQKLMVEKYPYLSKNFNVQLKDDVIRWTSKEINEEISEFLIENLDRIKDYCESFGWEVSDINEWIDITKDINGDGSVNEEDRTILNEIINNHKTYNESIMKRADLNLNGNIDSEDLVVFDTYINSGKLFIEIKQSSRKNYFPNKDMLVFVNQFQGTYLYNYAIRDGIGMDDIPHYNNNGFIKTAIFKCKPGQKLTIAHNNDKVIHMVIGSSPANLKQDLTGFMLQNVVEVDLKKGEGYQYTASSIVDGSGYDANWVCIQVPSNYKDLENTTAITEVVELGDINNDGQINMQDYHLLAAYTATGPGSENYHWKANARQLIAMDCNKDGVIDNKDTLMLKDYLDGKLASLGLAPYTYEIPQEADSGTNVKNLLIIEGHYDKSVNIPFNEFIEDDWVIHEKFFNYLLGMSIHNYSDSTNITYLQKLLKELYPEHSEDPNFFYPGKYSDNMRKIVLDYQKSKISYTKGDLNKDNKLTQEDLTIFRAYLDDPTHKDYEAGISKEDSDLLGPSQYDRADINSDGYRNEVDYKLLESDVLGETENLKEYDISFNLGWVDVQTEALLEQEYNSYGTISEVSK